MEIRMTGNKIIFFDIDGTLVDFSCHMPDSTKDALKLLRKNGHRLIISTGRSKSEVYPWLLDMEWDGLICAAGAYVEFNGSIIYSKYMEPSMVKLLTEYIESHNGTYILEGSEAIWEKKELIEQNRINIENWIRESHGDGNTPLIPKAAAFDNICQVSHIHKLNFHGMDMDINIMENEINTLLSKANMPGIHAIKFNMGNHFSTSGEITLTGIHKSHGMNLLLEASGYTKDSSIAFGDSLNDYEMIQNAGMGIAMGNACDSIKNAADYVTDHINENGIYNAAKKLRLI